MCAIMHSNLNTFEYVLVSSLFLAKLFKLIFLKRKKFNKNQGFVRFKIC